MAFNRPLLLCVLMVASLASLVGAMEDLYCGDMNCYEGL